MNLVGSNRLWKKVGQVLMREAYGVIDVDTIKRVVNHLIFDKDVAILGIGLI